MKVKITIEAEVHPAFTLSEAMAHFGIDLGKGHFDHELFQRTMITGFEEIAEVNHQGTKDTKL